MTSVISVVAIILSLIGTGVAVLSYRRVMKSQLPDIDFVVEEHANGDHEFKLRIDNPSRRSVVLDHVLIDRPNPDGVKIRPTNIGSDGEIERLLADHSTKTLGQKSVYLSVPAGEIRELEFIFAEDNIEIKLGDYIFNLPFGSMTRNVSLSPNRPQMAPFVGPPAEYNTDSRK